MIAPWKNDLQSRLDQIRASTDSDFAGLAMEEQHRRRIRWVAASGNGNDRYAELAVRSGRGVTGLAIKLGRPVVADAAMPASERERLLPDDSIMAVERLQAAIVVPLAIQDEIRGVLLVGSRSQRIYEEGCLQLAIEAADRLAPRLRQLL
ncbi:GAF domain-containing protein [Paenibacillus lycopersici]|uniref:GAF domain-containing protein n=1 Tax=Paenibacillus lycopersici TaxID=2704462 RepID=A0A6C0FX29_9BACL|nr:GAF domain-containing protein [Paenibacillus lycopersici]QHT59519.1 GAF domain-containing protein [Paenibacillus lycopersici]